MKIPPRMWWWPGAGAILMSSVGFGASVEVTSGALVEGLTSGFGVEVGFAVVGSVLGVVGLGAVGAFVTGSTLAVGVVGFSVVKSVSFFLRQYSLPLT